MLNATHDMLIGEGEESLSSCALGSYQEMVTSDTGSTVGGTRQHHAMLNLIFRSHSRVETLEDELPPGEGGSWFSKEFS